MVIIRKHDRINYLISGVCNYYQITPEKLKSRAGKNGHGPIKEIAALILKDIADLTHIEIEQALGYKFGYGANTTDLLEKVRERDHKKELESLLKSMGL